LATLKQILLGLLEFMGRGQTDPKVSTLLKLQRALERGGIIFIEPTAEHGPGLMLREGRKT
jgi:hypothetical protein